MNVIILNSRESLLPDSFTAIHVEQASEIAEQAQVLKHKHERCVVLNTSAEAVLAAYGLSLGVINTQGEFIYSVVDSHNTDQVSDKFYTVNQMKIAALIESIGSLAECISSSRRIVSQVEKMAEFLSDDTLQCIINGAAKDPAIAEHISLALAKGREQFDLRVRSMLFPAAAEQIDNKTFVPKGFVVNVSEMGTSKSESNMRLFESALSAGRKPMLFVPNISLTSPFSMRDEHYKNSCDTEGRMIVKAGAITTINSAKMSAHSELISKGDVKIFDEAVKLFEHINSDAFFDGKIADKRAGFKFVFEQMRAEDTVISDAHFGQAYIDILKGVVGREISAVEMPRGSYKDIKVHAGNLKVEDLIHIAKKMLKEGLSFAFYSDRKQQDAVAIYKELHDFADAHNLKSVLINAAEMTDETGSAYKSTVNPDDELSDKSVIFFTPAIGPGFSARLKSVNTILMDCCGTVSPISLVQTAFRFRCVKDIHMSFSIRKPATDYPETRSDVCFRAIESSDVVSNDCLVEKISALDFVRSKHDLLMSDPVMCAAFDFKALENWSRNRYKKFVITAMTVLGFDMNKAFTDVEHVAFEKPKKAARIKAEKEEVKQLFMSDEIISVDAAIALQKKGKSSGLTLHESRLLEKHTAGQMMGIEGAFTEDDYSFVESGGLPVVANLSLLKAKRTDELTNDVLNKIALMRDIEEFISFQSVKDGGFQDASFTQFISKLKSEKANFNGKEATKLTMLKNYFFIQNDAKNPRKSVCSIISLLGYKLRSDKNKKVGQGLDRKNANVLSRETHDLAIKYMSDASALRKATLKSKAVGEN